MEFGLRIWRDLSVLVWFKDSDDGLKENISIVGDLRRRLIDVRVHGSSSLLQKISKPSG